ncbi:LamG domain-containing protein [Rathayibacter sp. VKM Ac-2928]|uniref:LamG domain-containing protein n=1 Tax=Rathayibacter sp. VKM Ac-2928 TaxID=2929479 RepID=UPI001FB2597B|nr:LamG domain-containing protein [Rathayibacter sp. VKM Ac-2928]MCJ1685366.1 LamG domain-containing protein [Rathayibacter sp. VKM Ac-2928]
MASRAFRRGVINKHSRIQGLALITVTALTGVLMAPVASATSELAAQQPAAIGPVDSSGASTAADAAAIAAKFDHDVVVSSMTTATEITTALPDGTMQYVTSTEPQRVEEDGSWVDVDTTLSRTPSGAVEPEVAVVPVRFSGGGDDTLAQIQTITGAWLTMTWDHGVLPKPVLDGATALYEDVFPDVDLEVASTNVGMSQVLIVKTPEAGENPELDTVRFEFDGGEVSQADDGGLSAEVDGVDSALVSSEPTWWDSSSVDVDEQPTGDAPASSSVPTETTGDSISLDVDSVLETPNLEYPVYIDPDFNGTSIHSWWIASNLASSSFLDGQGNDGRGQSVGSVNDPAGNIRNARSFFLMNTNGIKGADIISASFSAHEIWSWNCTATPVELWWTGSMREGATWNESGGGNWIQRLDTVNASGRRGASDCPEKNVGWNAYEGAKVAAGANADSITFGLRAPNEGDYSQWKRFEPSVSMTVSYDRRPDTPTNVTMSTPDRGCGVASDPAWVTNNTPLVLRAKMHDTDGDQMYGRFQIVTANSGGNSHDAPPNSSRVFFSTTPVEPNDWDRNMTINAGTLPDGKYAWSARADDNRLQSDDSPWCYFNVRNNGPSNLPEIKNDSNPTSYTVGQPFNVHFEARTDDGVDRFLYRWIPTNGVPSNYNLKTEAGPLPACGSKTGLIYVVCPDSSGRSATITVAPISEISTLIVTSVDKVGSWANVGNSDGTRSTVAQLKIGASIDPAAASYNGGHGWLTQKQTSLSSPMADENTNNGTGTTAALPLSFGVGTDLTKKADLAANTVTGSGPSPASVIQASGAQPLTRWLSGSYHRAEIGDGSGTLGSFTFQGATGWLAPPGSTITGTTALYRCAGTNSAFVWTDSGCRGVTSTSKLIGYSWPSAAATGDAASGKELFLCQNGSNAATADYLQSTATDCEGLTKVKSLGFIWSKPGSTLEHSPINGTTGPAVNTTKSFTVSAWLNPDAFVPGEDMNAMSQVGTTNGGFYLQLINNGANNGNGTWRFCVRAQVAGSGADCATTPNTSGTDWTLLTGVYDSVNRRILLYTGTVLATTVLHSVPAGDSSASGPLVIGTGFSAGTYLASWKGQIANPAIFPGVQTPTQISSFYNVSH